MMKMDEDKCECGNGKYKFQDKCWTCKEKEELALMDSVCYSVGIVALCIVIYAVIFLAKAEKRKELGK